jgi:hypothetical protein
MPPRELPLPVPIASSVRPGSRFAQGGRATEDEERDIENEPQASPQPQRHGFALMIGISPFAHEESDEDSLSREDDVSEHNDGEQELHLPRFQSKAEIAKHIACLEHELRYYRALLSGDDRAASRAREQLHAAMSDGDTDE